MGAGKKRPKAYSHTDTAETESIRIFENSVDYKYIKLDIKERDKYPNSDGYLEIVGEDQISIGKMEVQIKTLPKKANSFTVDGSMIAYANEVTTLPFLLILVNREPSVVYWIRVSGKKNEFQVKLSELESINPTSNYLNKWKLIIQEYRRRIDEHPRLQELIQAYKYTIPLEGLDSNQIQFLQKFIDQINIKLDTEMRIVKEILFPRVWKLGIAINSFKDDFSFGLYAIKYGSQDSILIRSFEKGRFDIFRSQGMSSMYYSSSIPDDPIKLANSKLDSYFKDFLDSEMAPVILKEFANEYIYSVVNEYFYAFGYRKQSEKYKLSEVRSAIENIFFKWVYLAYKSINYPKHLKTLEIGMLSVFTNDFSRLEILEQAKTYSEDIPSYLFEAKDFRVPVFYKALDLLEQKGIEYVERTGPKPDNKRLFGQSPAWVWLKYDVEGIKEKIKLHYVGAFYLAEEYFKKVGLPLTKEFVREDNESLLISPIIKAEGIEAHIGVKILRVQVLSGEKFPRYHYLEIDELVLQDVKAKSYKVEIEGRLCLINRVGVNVHLPIFSLMPYRAFLNELMKEFRSEYYR